MTNAAKTALLVTAIVAALVIIGIFATRSGGSSGTVDAQPRQMKPGMRGGHRELGS